MSELKVLAFTCSYNRPYMLRQCILNIHNQTYKNIMHSINITGDGSAAFKILYDDLIGKNTLITHNKNFHQHINYMRAITNIPNYDTYDIFVKIDDDDIYKSNYIENIVNKFKEDTSTDIVSSCISSQLNNSKIYKGNFKNLGGNPVDYNLNMPMTYAFTKKAMHLIISESHITKNSYEGQIWRTIWSENQLKYADVNNKDNIIWHIHEKNISTSFMLKN